MIIKKKKVKIEPVFQSFKFYDGAVELRFDVNKHAYYLVEPGDILRLLDSVTTICKIIDKSNILINWAVKLTADRIIENVKFLVVLSEDEFRAIVIKAKSTHRERLEDAGSIGTQAHNFIEGYIQNEISNGRSSIEFPINEDKRISNCCWAALKWMGKHNVRWICTERKIYSRAYQYAGTLDGIALVDSCDDLKCCLNLFRDRRSLIDWKSSNQLYTEYLYQSAAYQQAVEEEDGEKIEDRWIIRLGKDDGQFESWHLEREETYEQDFRAFKACLDLTKSVRDVTNRMKEKGKN